MQDFTPTELGLLSYCIIVAKVWEDKDDPNYQKNIDELNALLEKVRKV